MTDDERFAALWERVDSIERSKTIFRVIEVVLYAFLVGAFIYMIYVQSVQAFLACNALIFIWIVARVEKLQASVDLLMAIAKYPFRGDSVDQGMQDPAAALEVNGGSQVRGDIHT